MGLTPNLKHIRLKRHPYISIHIPFYNEKNVVERSIAAATSFTGSTDDDKFPRNTTYRLWFEVSNEGGYFSGGVTYQFQVAQTDTCSSGDYSVVPTTSGGHWQIVGSTYIATGGEPTSNIFRV